MILSPHEPWYVAAATAAVAILSKYLVRVRTANVFNPAAIALIATFYVFDTGQSWWGALPAASPFAMIIVLTLGIFITDRVNKMPLVLAFLGAFYLLATVLAFVIEPGRVAEVFRTPDVQAAIFFAVFILDDPPTSPIPTRDQIVCGVIVAAVSVGVFVWIGAAYYLLAGVLVGNVWEAWRRVARRHRVTFPQGVGRFALEVTPLRDLGSARS
jgi:Na+-translocating ferredoxin:NAD+ oxidoreductase RnfD subunit